MKNLVRKNIQKLAPYENGYRENIKECILLNANENPYLPYPDNEQCVCANRYYDDNLYKLYKIFADLYKVKEDNIIITKGSDEAIELLVKTFCEPKEDYIMVFSPTFSMYKFYADVQDVKTVDIPLILNDRANLNIEKITEYKNNPPKIIFITNPQAPAGNLLNREDIIKIIKTFDKKSVIVIDEAYIEFSENESFADELKKYNSIAILRTLSKAYSMAGLRIGCCISSREITETLKKVQPPYSISTKSTEIAVKALSKEGLAYAKKNIEKIIQQRKTVFSILKNMKNTEKIFLSDTNFIFFKYKNIEKLKSECMKKNIILRFYKNEFKDYVRYTVSNEKENDYVISLLKELDDNEQK